MRAQYVVSTPLAPGGIAVITVTGEVPAALRAVTGSAWPDDAEAVVGRVRLVRMAGVDEGLAAVVSPACALLMPHGGVRIVQRVCEALRAAGVEAGDEGDVEAMYPEASNLDEALMLAALARARSRDAIDLLPAQPARWRRWRSATERESPEEISARSMRLNRLIDPPTVAVVGAPNVGKSTLTNALLGRSVSLAADEPGTTRDAVGAVVDLGGLTVFWYDTPGRRHTEDAIEAASIRLAERLIVSADLVISAEGPGLEAVEGGAGVLRVHLKADLGGRSEAGVLRVSAATGAGLSGFVEAVRERLVPGADFEAEGPWRFDARLEW